MRSTKRGLQANRSVIEGLKDESEEIESWFNFDPATDNGHRVFLGESSGDARLIPPRIIGDLDCLTSLVEKTYNLIQTPNVWIAIEGLADRLAEAEDDETTALDEAETREFLERLLGPPKHAVARDD